jgi:hypothetical protein
MPTSKKCDLIILGEDHNKPYAKQLSLALLQAAKEQRYDRVVFAYEASDLEGDRGKRSLKNLADWNNHDKEHLSPNLSNKDRQKTLKLLDATDKLYEYVLDDANIEYIALEDSEIREECRKYIYEFKPLGNVVGPETARYYEGLASHYDRREEFMTDTLRNHIEVPQDKKDNVFVLLLAGADHIRNLESLFREKMRDSDFEVNVINLPVSINKPRDIGKDALDVKKAIYHKDPNSQNGIMEIFQRRRGNNLQELEEEYVEKLESIFSESSISVLKKPLSIGCSSEYIEVYRTRNNERLRSEEKLSSNHFEEEKPSGFSEDSSAIAVGGNSKTTQEL